MKSVLTRSAACRLIAVPALLMTLSACSMLSDKGPEKDYLKAPTGRALELPPELGVGEVKEPRIQLPKLNQPVVASPECQPCAIGAEELHRDADLPAGSVVPGTAAGRLVRSGDITWLELEASPERTWGMLQQYVRMKGLSIQSAQPREGLIETDWSDVNGSDPFSALSAPFKTRSTGTLGRFRFGFRLERTPKDNSRVFVRHEAVLARSTGNELEVSDPEVSNRLLMDILKTGNSGS